MRFLSKIRTGGLRLPRSVFGMGLCVFVWGLRTSCRCMTCLTLYLTTFPQRSLSQERTPRDSEGDDGGGRCRYLCCGPATAPEPDCSASCGQDRTHLLTVSASQLPSRTRMLESAACTRSSSVHLQQPSADCPVQVNRHSLITRNRGIRLSGCAVSRAAVYPRGADTGSSTSRGRRQSMTHAPALPQKREVYAMVLSVRCSL